MPLGDVANQAHLSTKSDTIRGVIHSESHEATPMLARRPSRNVLLVIGLAVLWAALAFAAGASAARAGDGHVVEIVDFAYAPADLTVAVGDTVTFTNLDAVEHTATATDGSWGTGLLAEGESAAITFSAAGTYDYLCTPHPSMTGRITVVAQSAATPTPTTGGGALPDVAMSADSTTSRAGLTFLGLALVGVALLLVVLQAVVRGLGERGEG